MGTENIQNTADDWKGRAKEAAGDVTDNEHLQSEGAMDQAKAKAKRAAENVKDDLEDAKESVKDTVRSVFDR